MKATIASLKFSPGHYSHVVALSKILQELDFETMLVLDGQYRSFSLANPDERFVFVDGKTGYDPLYDFEPDFHIVFNLSTHDSGVLRRLKKKNPLVKQVIVYHEPYRGFLETIKSLASGARSLNHVFKIMARHVFSANVLRQCDQVWLPSKSACDNYAICDVKLNSCYREFPLVFTDEAEGSCSIASKEYFSFISTALPAKGFSEFLGCVRQLSQTDDDMKFQIVTKTDITGYIDDALRRLQDQGRLLVEHGKPHSNEAINAAYDRSVCTWFGYNASTQSGVLCKSFMFGAPGVATRVGAFEEYIDGNNSVFIEDNSDASEVYEAYRRIANNKELFVKSARESYLRFFDYTNYIDLTRALLAEMKLFK